MECQLNIAYGKCIALSLYIRKETRLKINDLSKEVKQGKIYKLKENKRKEIKNKLFMKLNSSSTQASKNSHRYIARNMRSQKKIPKIYKETRYHESDTGKKTQFYPESLKILELLEILKKCI